MAEDTPKDELDAWNRASAGWERRNDQVTRMTGGVARRMVELLGPQPGETVLELASGVGDTGYLAAQALGAEGRLISTDFSPGMVDVARRRAETLGVVNVEHRVMDATAIDLPDRSVDGVLCRFGLMLIPEPARVLADIRRVLGAEGGRAVVAVWAEPERNPWATTFGRALVRAGHVAPPEPGGPGMFALAEPATLAGLARAAGFTDVDVEELELAAEYGSFEDYWGSIMDMAANTSALVAALPEAARAELRETVERDAEPYRAASGGYRFPAAALVAVAR